MKSVTLCGADGDDFPRFVSLSEEGRAAQFGEVGAWYAATREKIKGGNQLAHPPPATPVRFSRGGKPLVTDGPFLEGDEVIGGYMEIEVDSLDEALEMAKTWPPRGAVEIRPVHEVATSPRPKEEAGQRST